MFIKFLLQDKEWQRLQNQQKDILQQKNVVAGKNLPYGSLGLIHPKVKAQALYIKCFLETAFYLWDLP